MGLMVTEMDKFDLIVIGAGPGGYVAAIKAAKAGLNTAIVESIRVGGTCLNRGCIPTKAMIHASSLYKEILHESPLVGISVDGAEFDYGKIIEYRGSTVDELVTGIEDLLDANGVTRIYGRGVLEAGEAAEGGRLVSVYDAAGCCTEYAADKVLLATGSVPELIPVPGIDLPGVLTSDGVFALEEMPESLVVIGGGVIGVEFATIFANLGAKVTLVVSSPKVLFKMDKEISQNLKMIIKKSGVEVYTGCSVQKIEEGCDCGNGYTVFFEEKGKEQTACGQYVLCAKGRKPNLDGVFGEGVEIAMTGRFIDTDAAKGFETSMPGVYAIGDIIPGIQLAHTASAHGICCIEKMTGEAPSLNLELIPSCVYTDPEIAQVGLTEADAKEQDIPVKVGKFIMSANGRSLISHEERGFIKVVVSEDDNVVLGAQMMCARATDMIGEFTTAIANGLTVHDMLAGVRAHPTYNEGITDALEAAIGESIHTMPKRRRK